MVAQNSFYAKKALSNQRLFDYEGKMLESFFKFCNELSNIDNQAIVLGLKIDG